MTCTYYVQKINTWYFVKKLNPVRFCFKLKVIRYFLKYIIRRFLVDLLDPFCYWLIRVKSARPMNSHPKTDLTSRAYVPDLTRLWIK